MSISRELLSPDYFHSGPADGLSVLQRAQKAVDDKRWSEAELLYLRALQSLRETLGEDHLEVAMVLHNLATVVAKQGREMEARQLNKEVTSILMKLNKLKRN